MLAVVIARQIIAALALASALPAFAQGLVQTPAATMGDIAAAVPPTCATPPAPDAAVATAGTAAPCVPRADAARATPIPQTSTTTAADATFTGTWKDAGGASITLPAAPSRATAWIESTTAPYICQVAVRTAAGYSGKCWQLVSTNLPSTPTALLNLTVSPVANPAAGLTVNVIARQ